MGTGDGGGGDGVYSVCAETLRYLPHSLAITTNVRRIRKEEEIKWKIMANNYYVRARTYAYECVVYGWSLSPPARLNARCIV